MIHEIKSCKYLYNKNKNNHELIVYELSVSA